MMYNNSFYGGQKGADIKLVHTFPCLNVRSDGRGMLNDLSKGYTSNINLGDYVIIAYGKEGNDLYEQNAAYDGVINWNSSIWEKVFIERLIPNEIYANPHAIGWNYKLITQFTNKFDNALSVKYSYDFYTYGPESDFNSGVADTLEAVGSKLQVVHGGQKIDGYFYFEDIQEKEPVNGEYYVILDSFTIENSSRYFPEDTWEMNEGYPGNIIVTKADDSNTYQNVTSDFTPIRSNQIIAINHYYEDDGASSSIGNIEVSESGNFFEVKIQGITNGKYKKDGFGSSTLLTSEPIKGISEFLSIYDENEILIYELTFEKINGNISIKVETSEASTPKYKSYWYFQLPSGEWKRVLITGDLSDIVKNEKYNDSDANSKIYSAEYINNLIQIQQYELTQGKKQWTILFNDIAVNADQKRLLLIAPVTKITNNDTQAVYNSLEAECTDDSIIITAMTELPSNLILNFFLI